MAREWIGLTLVLLGLARAAVVVMHSPMIGYANQADMHRTGACAGLYPAIEAPARYQASTAAPIERYRIEAVQPANCYPSTEAALAVSLAAVSQSAGKGDRFNLAWMGLAKLVMLAGAALLFAWALHPHPAAAVLHGAFVLGVLADPVVTLWFNTLYTEFTAIWGLYVVTTALAALALWARGGFLLWTLLAAGISVLAFSREQYALLVPFLVLTAAPWLWIRSRGAVVAMALLALLCAVGSFALLPRPPVIQEANRADAYLGVILPVSSDPRRALATLELPERCETLVGATWYRQRGEDVHAACPEVLRLSSVAFLRLAPGDPAALARAVAIVLPTLQALGVPYAGTLSSVRDVRVHDLPLVAFSPLHEASRRMPVLAYATLVLAACLASVLAGAAALVFARPLRREPHVALLLGMLLGGIAIYTLLTTVFGDGLADAARHFLPGSLAVVAALLAVAAGVPLLAARWLRTPRRRLGEIAFGVVAVALVAAACVQALEWAAKQPLAIGVLDEPAGRRIAPEGVALRGWALDPFGVERVELDLSGRRRAVATGLPTPVVEEHFPGYPGAGQAGFRAALTREELGAGSARPVDLRVLARNRHGVATEVDRRRLELP